MFFQGEKNISLCYSHLKMKLQCKEVFSWHIYKYTVTGNFQCQAFDSVGRAWCCKVIKLMILDTDQKGCVPFLTLSSSANGRKTL